VKHHSGEDGTSEPKRCETTFGKGGTPEPLKNNKKY
jgi:hypothetical protein